MCMCSLWFQIWSDMRYTLRIFCFWSVLYSIWICMKYLWDDYYYYIFPGGFTRLSWFIPYSYSMRRAFWHRRTWQFGIKYIHIFISLSSISHFFFSSAWQAELTENAVHTCRTWLNPLTREAPVCMRVDYNTCDVMYHITRPSVANIEF